MRTLRTLTILVLLTLAATACGGGSTAQHDQPAGSEHGQENPRGDLPTDGEPAIDGESVIAQATSAEVTVHESPAGPVTTTFAAQTSFGSPRTFLVTAEEGDWLEVLLPVRPNGSTGWIHRHGVELGVTTLHVDVDLDARELTVVDGDRVVLSSPVAIGGPGNPTPRGRFFVTDLLETPDPTGAYGPYAFGLSGYSETLTEFAGGDGQVGIHGTDDPASIGEAVSHGCVRLPNEVIAELAGLLPLGTPVLVR